MPGRVYIRSKTFPRKPGPWGALPFFATETNHISVDVTTGQRDREAPGRVAFSPMHVFDGTYRAPDGSVYACFEHYWQSLKHFPHRSHAADKAWWRNQTVARRRLPRVSPASCLYASDETRYPGQTFNYTESRKVFYVPDYSAKLRTSALARALIQELKRLINAGFDIIVEDFDGPRDDEGRPLIEEVTLALLRQKIDDTSRPFGHGYVVAAELLGIPCSAYTA